MAGFELHLLGGAVLREGERTPLTGRVVHRHRLALLARLASAAPDSVSRDKLLGLLWPERDETSARHLLRAALHDIRHALGVDVVPMGGSDLRLDPRRIFVDVQLFQARLAAGDLEGAVALYEGPFLDGFTLDGAEEFDAWAAVERARLAGMYEAALEQLATSAEARQAPERASEYWSTLAAARPTDGRIALRLLESLDASGDSAAALAHAAAHARRLHAELGASVDPPFASRVAALRRKLLSAGNESTAKDAAVDATALEDSAPIVVDDALAPSVSEAPRGTWFNPKPSRRALAWTLGSVGVVAIAAMLLVGLTWGSRPAKLRGATAATVIAVAPFDEVGTVPHEVRDGLATLITANLDQVDELRLVPAAQVAARAHASSATSPAEMLQALHAELLVTGVVVPAPEGIAVTTRIVDKSGAVRAMGEARGSVADLATLVDHISLTLLRDLWGRRWGVPTPRLAAVVTPSAPALRAYLRGEMFLRAALWDSAATEFATAIDQDSAFALAHLRIAEPYGWRYGMSSAPAQRALASAARFADRLPPRERMLLTVRRLHESGAMSALDSSGALAERYPDDAEAQYVRADVRFHAIEATGRNMIARAATAFDTATTLDSNSARVFAHPLSLALMTGDSVRFDRAAGRLMSLGAGSHMQIAQGWDYALLRRVRFGSQDEAARTLQARLREATPPPFWQLTDLLPALERAVYSADVPNPELVVAIHETIHNAYRAEPARIADADGLRSAVLIGLGRMNAAHEWTGRTWDAFASGAPGLMLIPVVLGYAPAGWLDGVSERIAATPYWQSTPIIRRRAEYWRG
ncbi:MAG: BTAD domain-containing putative transcriptional regulator, partial [bacterium]